MDALENVHNWERVVQRAVDKQDFVTAVEYLNNILGECQASVTHSVQKIEYLLKSSQIQEALNFTEKLV